MLDINDPPIPNSDFDKFGFKNLGNKISGAIKDIENVDGTVISIYGPWGSGKSSLINIIKSDLELTSDYKISNFNCWWIKGEEALVSEFFRHIYSVVGTSSHHELKKLIADFGSRVLTNFSPAIGSISNLILPGSSRFAAKIAEGIGNSLKQDENLDSMYKDLRALLTKSCKKYVIIIDDIDRLLPEEMLLIFKLVKTVGRLPNFTYLLAYDRKVAEELINDEFPSIDGIHFLEKIVQTGFDVPVAPISKLSFKLRNFLTELVKDPNLVLEKHFKILYNFVIIPSISTPRNLVRLCDTLSVTWKAVQGEVDTMDFVTIEVFRLFYPKIYDFIKLNKHYLIVENFSENAYNVLRDRLPIFFKEELKLGNEDLENKLKVGLAELFPSLNVDSSYTQISEDINKIQNFLKLNHRICVQNHFNTYFEFTSNDEIVGLSDINTFVIDDESSEKVRNFIQSTLDEGRERSDPKKIMYLIQEIGNHVDKLSQTKIELVVSEILLSYDEIYEVIFSDIDANQLNLFYEIVKNFLSICLSKFEIQERSRIIMSKIGDTPSFNLCFDLARVARQQMDSGSNNADPSKNFVIVSSDDADILFSKAEQLIDKVYSDGDLINHPNLFNILWWWDILKGHDEPYCVKKWFDELTKDKDALVKFAELFIRNQNTNFQSTITRTEVSRSHFDVEKLNRFAKLSELENHVQIVINNQDSSHSNQNLLIEFVDILDQFQKSEKKKQN